jgi:hypothetical protein
MDEQENARARTEAVRSDSAVSSADRARFWAGLNRYLASELQHEVWVPEADKAVRRRTGDEDE